MIYIWIMCVQNVISLLWESFTPTFLLLSTYAKKQAWNQACKKHLISRLDWIVRETWAAVLLLMLEIMMYC